MVKSVAEFVQKMAVTPDEDKKYLAFIEEQVKALKCLEVNREEIIWHYTTGEALLGIVESGTLYSTQVSCLNDSTELRYAAKLLREAFKDVQMKDSWPAEEAQLLDRLLTATAAVEEPSAAPLLASNWFVVCFSKERDNLSQWRAYGVGENGYAIGFVAGGFFGLGSLVVRVNYAALQHKQVATEVAQSTLRFFQEGLDARSGDARTSWAEEFLARWDFWLGRLAPMVKDPAFSAENEYRIIHELQPNERGKLQFRQRHSLMSRHLPLAFPPPALAAHMLPIAEVMVGPSRHKEISRTSVDAFMRQKGYPQQSVPVSISSVPFQTT